MPDWLCIGMAGWACINFEVLAGVASKTSSDCPDVVRTSSRILALSYLVEGLAHR